MSNLVTKSLNYGGQIAALILPNDESNSTGLMNPSVFVDNDGDILVNLRNVNYTLYHCENKQLFPSRWGPLTYLHPESDMHLRTINFLCRLNENLEMTDFAKVDTTKFDKPPLWEFVGEEDCRLVQWDDKYYLIGVRRDTETTGIGRMELSEIQINKNNWSAEEISRLRIPSTGDDNSYCEKNWVPILDMPYHFVKWSHPTEIVRTYPELPPRCEQVILAEGKRPYPDQRGGSHVIKWKDHYISFSHEVIFCSNYLGRKDAVYRHRLLIWNEKFELIGFSPAPISFLDGRIEFCAGAAKYQNDLLITFGYHDNAAYILRTPGKLIDEMIEEALNV